MAKIACGCYHSILLSETGHVFTFGRGNHGQLGHGTKDNISVPKLIHFFKDKKATDIAGGFYHTIVLVNNRGPKINSLSYDMKKLLSDPSRCETGSYSSPYGGDESLYQHQQFDVSFDIEGKLIHAHRCIIMVRCKGLHEEIEDEAIESSSEKREQIGTNAKTHHILKISDIQSQAMLLFLEFIYTGMIQNVRDFDSKVILDVFILALRFKVKKLVQECDQFLSKNIDSENWAVILVKTNELGDEASNLKSLSYDYIIENFGKVIDTQEFLLLPKDLMGQVFKKASKLGVKINSNNNVDSD